MAKVKHNLSFILCLIAVLYLKGSMFFPSPKYDKSDSESNEEMEKMIRRVKQCSDECEYKHHSSSWMSKQMKGGKYKCSLTFGEPFVADTCTIDCLKLSEARDPRKCFCEFCKRPLMYMMFCNKSGKQFQHHIDSWQCNELVCTGQVKFYGNNCNTDNEAERHLFGGI